MTCFVTRASHVTAFRTGFPLIGHCLDLTTIITLLSHDIPKLVLHFPSFRYNPHTQESFTHVVSPLCLSLMHLCTFASACCTRRLGIPIVSTCLTHTFLILEYSDLVYKPHVSTL